MLIYISIIIKNYTSCTVHPSGIPFIPIEKLVIVDDLTKVPLGETLVIHPVKL